MYVWWVGTNSAATMSALFSPLARVWNDSNSHSSQRQDHFLLPLIHFHDFLTARAAARSNGMKWHKSKYYYDFEMTIIEDCKKIWMDRDCYPELRWPVLACLLLLSLLPFKKWKKRQKFNDNDFHKRFLTFQIVEGAVKIIMLNLGSGRTRSFP